MLKKNFHTHTSFCDGKHSAEEMVLSAIEKGFSHLGFSAHSYEDYDPSWCIAKENEVSYIAEIRRLKEKYKDKIKIYCGIELDSYSDIAVNEYEYIIASVHTIKKDGIYHSIDESRDALIKSVNTAWNGDFYALAKDYYEAVAKQNGDILGHIDLITKFNEGGCLFDESDKRYLSYAENAVRAIASKGMLFEINTGAIARGYRTTPYPNKEILKMIKKYGGRVTINSDCHHKDYLDCAFDEAEKYAKECGFSKIYYPFEEL